MRSGVFLRWVAHPLTVGATVVLLLNDHVFKQAWPGLVTGKLSDVAGLVVAPPVLGLLLGLVLAERIGAAVAVLLTGVGFVLVKLTSVGAEVASAAWSVVNGPSVVLADSTDLVALPALGLAWWVWRRVVAAPALPDGLAFRLRVVVAVPFAVLAITATSAPGDIYPSVDAVRGPGEGEAGAQVVIEVDGRLYGSQSGVDGWTFLSEPSLTDSRPQHQRTQYRRQVEACVPQDATHCYRARGGDDDARYVQPPRDGHLLGVDETTDAGQTWHTAWEVPAGRWPFILRQHRTHDMFDYMPQVSSVEVLVREVPGGHQVIVANGVEGLAVRGVDGVWSRVPVVDTATGLYIRPAPLTSFGWGIGDTIANAGLVTLLALLIGTSVAAGRARARRGRGPTAVLVLLLLLGCLIVLAIPIIAVVAHFATSSGTSTALGLVIALCLVSAGTALTLTQGALRKSRAAVITAAAVLTGLAFVGPVFGWTMGYPQDRGPAIELGVVLAAGCLFLVVAAGWWAGRDPIERLDPVVGG